MRRSEHAACTPSPGVMIVHGGWDQFSGLQSDAPDVGGGSDGGVGEGVGTAAIVHNDTFVVSLGSRLWSRIATGGGGPGAVRGASMSCTGGAAYLFGGHGSGIDFPGTIKVLSPNSTLWRMAPREDWAPVDLWSNSKPPPLSYATMNQVSGNLYLFGGLGASRDASSVLWRFTPAGEGGKWDAMMATGVGRLMHSATTLPIPAGYHSVTPRQHHSTAARTPCCQPNPDPLQSLESEWRSNCLERVWVFANQFVRHSDPDRLKTQPLSKRFDRHSCPLLHTAPYQWAQDALRSSATRQSTTPCMRAQANTCTHIRAYTCVSCRRRDPNSWWHTCRQACREVSQLPLLKHLVEDT